jgi:hypothetical protein
MQQVWRKVLLCADNIKFYRCDSSELTSPGVSRNTNCVLPSIPIALALHLVVCTLLDIEQTCKNREQHQLVNGTDLIPIPEMHNDSPPPRGMDFKCSLCLSVITFVPSSIHVYMHVLRAIMFPVLEVTIIIQNRFKTICH